MKISRIPALILTTGLLQLTAPCALLAQTVFTDAGAGSVAEVTAARDAFRAAIGGGTTPGANGSFGGVRFEINWDGVPNTFSGPNNFPANFFNVNSPRGVVFNTPGTGFEVSASALSGTPAKFGNIDPSFTGRFATFSPERLFTSLGSNVFDVSFFLPGASTAALTNGFAAIFTDVDFPNLTSITYFNATNEALGTWYAPVHAGNQTLSFLGVVFDAPIVSRVRVTLGNTAIDSTMPGADYVVVDDLLYGAPVAPSATSAVPEPSTYAFGFMMVAAAAMWRRRARAARCS